MPHDNDTIRRIAADLDQDIPLLKILAAQAKEERERLDLLLTIDAAKLYRFRLKDLGHAGHFDTPEEGDTP